MQDRNFDDLAHKLKTHIYDSPKGAIRLAILQRDIDKALQATHKTSLNILDAGAGAGIFSSRFAQQGHRITLCDISASMLSLAKKEYEKIATGAEVRFIHGPIQAFMENDSGSFDLILVHALLEWLAEPQRVLQSLLERVKPGGMISILFYNRHGLVMQNLILGNLTRIRKGELAGRGNSLTPINPLDPEEVMKWLGEEFVCLNHSGVRCFYDFMPPWIREKESQQALIDMEMSLSHTEPYRSFARYQHAIFRKKGWL